MAYRVVRYTEYNRVYYKVQTNRILGFIPFFWRTVILNDDIFLHFSKFTNEECALDFYKKKTTKKIKSVLMQSNLDN